MTKRIIASMLALSICLVGAFLSSPVIKSQSGDNVLAQPLMVLKSETNKSYASQPQKDSGTVSITAQSDEKATTVEMEIPDNLVNLNIDNTNPVSTNFIGIGGVYHGSGFLPDYVMADPYNEEQIQTEIENVKKSGASWVRTMFVEDVPWDPDTKSLDWESEGMQGYYKFFDAMQDAGITIAINAGWTLSSLDGYNFVERRLYPVFVKMAEKDGITNPTKDQCVKYYAQLYSEFVEEVIVKRGYSCIKYMLLFTEPNNAGFGDKKAQSKELFDYWHFASRSLHNALVEDDNRDLVKFIGPNTTFSCDLDWVNWAVQEVDDIIDIYSCHLYGYTDSWYDGATPYNAQTNWCERVAEAVKSTGKPFITDETNFAINNPKKNEGLALAQYADNEYSDMSWETPLSGVLDAMNYIANMNAGASGVLRWSLVSEKFLNSSATNIDSFVEGIQICGLLPYVKVSGTPLYRFYAYEMVASSVNGHPDTKVYAVDPTDDIYSTMTQSSDGTSSIILVNNGLFEQTVSINLKESLGGKTVYKYVYDPNTIEATNSVTPLDAIGYYEDITDNITDIIAPNTVVVYTTVRH